MSTPTHPHLPTSPGAPDDQRVESVDEYLHNRQAFRIHAAVFAATMVLIFAVNLSVNLSAGIAGQWSAWWSVWALIGWGSGIAVHGFVLWLSRPASGLLQARQDGEAR